ncbi:neocarzinostatin apoprotein domain-containing protein [Streptomyces sp. NPDC051162]|uniref:neocarzinostatin apoprotein domain-containing protein n=1 Tax=unclassified Streptomyces TaxID=2593676 RepID=UPI00341B8D0C
MALRGRRLRGRRIEALTRGAVALALACAGAVAVPAAASTPAPAASSGPGCATDTGAKGLASDPVAGSLVSVDRADGRIAQFQLFHDATATRGLPFAWHREQSAPGGAYGPWQRVGPTTVGPKNYAVAAIENSAGGLELLLPAFGAYCHVVEDGSEGGWSDPEPFGLRPAPYHGGVVLFKERDGSIDAFAAGPENGDVMELRRQRTADDGWGPVRSTGRLPDPNAGLGEPGTVEQLPDGRLHLTAREWNRDRTWEVHQSAPGGGWDAWQLLPPVSARTRPAALAAGPRLDVNRTGGLLDGDIVEFTIAGGPPKERVWVKQCGPSASVTTCDDATGRQFRVYPDGTYERSPKKLYAQLSTTAGNIDCRTAPADDPCSLALTDNTGALLATTPLRFRPHGRPEAPPTLDVTPDEGLVDGRPVRATGQGYEPQYHVLVMECATGSADTSGCRPRTRPPATSDDGRLDETVTLSSTFTGIDGRSVDCRAQDACELVVFGTRVRGPESVRHPLGFARAGQRQTAR